jgi:hypothetical protein
MRIFRVRTAYDDQGNSPWDAVWYDGDDSDLDVLDTEIGVARVWKPPAVRFEKRVRSPDIYVFQVWFAVTERVSKILSPLVTDTVEFLPLHVAGHDPFLVLHSLRRVDLDQNAIVRQGEVSGNISVIRKYSFRREQLEEGLHVFQVRQALGSASRDAGLACSGVLVSSEFKQACEKNKLLGVTFEEVYDESGRAS